MGSDQEMRSTLDPAVSPGESARPTLVDPYHQAQLEQFGFAVLPALDADLLGAVRDAYAALGPAPDDPQRAINWSFHSRSAEYKRSVKEELLPLVGPVLESMLVDHAVYLTTFITKWPGPDGGFAVHQDPSLLDERRFRGVTIWIPLEDTGIVDGRDNGMLWIVPGSHRFSPALRLPDVDKFQFADHEAAVLERHGVGVPTTAGEALVFDNRVLHYSMPNETDEPRVVLSFGVRPSEAACVHLRSVGGDLLDLYEVPDDFYIDVLPAEQHLWQSPDPPIAQLRAVEHRWSGEEFDDLCEAVSPVSRPTVSVRTSTWRDPGLFCALCGSTEGLDDHLREGRNNAQLVCASCREGLPSTSSA
jgi:Phytanoyl-CoA dioxygenase (PhyH)